LTQGFSEKISDKILTPGSATTFQHLNSATIFPQKNVTLSSATISQKKTWQQFLSKTTDNFSKKPITPGSPKAFRKTFDPRFSYNVSKKL